MLKPRYWGAAFLAAVLHLTTVPSFAQQISGTPGSPSATTTLSGKQLLLPPDPKFGGVIPTPTRRVGRGP